ncbi:MAG: dihydrolipoyl dehydrogenase [Nitrospina sp.]|jgi:pyruvate/2-oxoglutarate dehydrogenase complex dihydrolipoamide dehydrogenase (E3) component|nr:dihydrolipoyl dehydrogenase [Nitrospina sp.]MBT3508031.1 dihydrolipoyl dehydrogenase [Nitrospina sp.]MBT3876558.1 dihydrolipoyl dehydrogenase [Nitrospina sp.]MBT4049577.1 dihydrolipoyl dehydrogenase [Nitrospina sp.]MBT4558289.1 dihydrolipoyl dehydrogenase [Nitrospina sp.]
MDFDVAIIGGGSAGYSAASTAQSLGARVAIIDPGPLGGLCILKGCMPTKTILRSSDIMALMRRAEEFGIQPVDPQACLPAINDRKNKLIQDFADYRIQQLKDERFTLIQERAEFISPHEVRVGDQTLKAKSFILATGSVIADYPVPGLKETGFITSDDVLQMREAPKSVIVLGAGAVAVELAQFFLRIGVEVSLLQRSPHILSKGDEDLARPVEHRFRQEGMNLYTGTNILRAEKEQDGATVYFQHEGEEKSVRAQTILQALGRRPNIDGLDLESANVETHNGRISVDAKMKTNQPHIFAVGDVNGIHEVVHIAIQQGEVAGYNATHPESEREVDDRLKSSVVFTDPAVASVGLSEKECQAGNIAYLAASHPFDDHGKSMCLGETHGHVKLLCDPVSGKVLGGHIVGPEAGELIHELITLMHFGGTVKDLAGIPHYHPTLAEILTYPAEELSNQLSSR